MYPRVLYYVATCQYMVVVPRRSVPSVRPYYIAKEGNKVMLGSGVSGSFIASGHLCTCIIMEGRHGALICEYYSPHVLHNFICFRQHSNRVHRVGYFSCGEGDMAW